MKFSVSAITLALFAVASAAPLAVAVAAPNAVAVAAPDAAPAPLAFAQAKAEAKAAAAAQAAASVDVIFTTISSLSANFNSLTSVLLNAKGLPDDLLSQIVSVVVNLLQGVLDQLGSGLGLDPITDAVNNLLSEALKALDVILETTGLDATVSALLATVINTVKSLLAVIVPSLLSIVGALLSGGLTGLVTGLIGGVLDILSVLLG